MTDELLKKIRASPDCAPQGQGSVDHPFGVADQDLAQHKDTARRARFARIEQLIEHRMQIGALFGVEIERHFRR